MHLAVYIKKQALREDPRVLALRKRLEEAPFELVHAHAPFLAGLAARRIAKKRNIPLVATFHSKYYDDVYKGTIGDWVGARKYTYAHPTGFFLGVTEGDLISLGVFAGKQFVF